MRSRKVEPGFAVLLLRTAAVTTAHRGAPSCLPGGMRTAVPLGLVEPERVIDRTRQVGHRALVQCRCSHVAQPQVFAAQRQHMSADAAVDTGQQWAHLEPVGHHAHRLDAGAQLHLGGEPGADEEGNRLAVLRHDPSRQRVGQRCQQRSDVDARHPPVEAGSRLVDQAVEHTVIEAVVRMPSIDRHQHRHARRGAVARQFGEARQRDRGRDGRCDGCHGAHGTEPSRGSSASGVGGHPAQRLVRSGRSAL